MKPGLPSDESAQEQLWQRYAEQLKATPTPENYARAYDEINRFLQQHGDPAHARQADGTIYGPTGDINDWEKKVIVALAVDRGKRVLDLGCGDGRLAMAMARQGAIVKGIDISAVAIECARRLAARSNASVEFQVANAIELSETSGTFDYAVSCDMVEHLNPKHVAVHLREVYRVLRTGGAYIISLPAWLPDGKVDPLHLGNYHSEEVRAMLQQAGFKPKSAAQVLFERNGDLTFIIGAPRTSKAKLVRFVTKLPVAGSIVARRLINRWWGGNNFFYAEK